MYFTTYLAAALLAISASAADVTVHVVKVSAADANKLTFTPTKLQAAVGDMVQFQFGVGAHTVTQSSFDNPCVPLGYPSNLTGINSGSMPVKAGDVTVPTYTISVKDTKPMWLYCATAKHCQGGMVMVVNENTTKNATRSLENFKAAAALAPENIAPSSPSGGQASSQSSSGSTSTSTDAGYGSGSYGDYTSTAAAADATGTATADNSTATGTDSVPSGTFTGAAGKLYAPAMAGVMAMGAALLL